MNTTSATFTDEVSAVAKMVGSSTNMAFLRNVDRTIDAVIAYTNNVQALNNLIHLTCVKLKAHPVEPGKYIDPDDESISVFKSGYESLESEIPKLLLEKKKALEEHGEVDEDAHVALADEIDRYLEAMATCVECLRDLCAEIISHDLKAEPRNVDTHDNVRDLILSLRA
jgi:hypothetical protein